MPSSGNNPLVTNPAIPAPTVDAVSKICSFADPVNRNLQITACYGELSAAFAGRTGAVANWCTFATWASKQAGVTIRGEDLQRKLEEVLTIEPEIRGILAALSQHARKLGSGQVHENIHQKAVHKLVLSAQKRAGDAVARGNKKVFEEIGKEFARFIETCLHDEAYKEETIQDFCKKLRPGPPPDGQDALCRAFKLYYKAFFETDENVQNELILLANIEIGFHEQTRLQPEIAESLNAALVDPQHVRDYLTDLLVNSKSATGKLGYFFSWLAGGTALFKKASDLLVSAAEKHIRRVITKHLMTLNLPPNLSLHLGADLTAPYPEDLKIIQNPELLALLKQIKPALNTRDGAGTDDWSDLKQRIHYIANLFRCYHQSKDLYSAAFTAQQLAVIKAGGVPAGEL